MVSGRVPGPAGVLDRLWQGAAGWWGPLLDMALAPLEGGYRLASGVFHGVYARGVRRVHRAPIPVISVGNLAVGGTGKTPVAAWIVDELLRRGACPAVLHGGYAPDEPALHRRWHPDVPVIAERDRVIAARYVAEAGATVVVLDDGFQHRRLHRDLDVVLLAAETWQPRPRLLPRGPWREPPAALRRADVVVVTRKTATASEARRVAEEARAFAPDAVWLRLALEARRWRRLGDEVMGQGSEGPEGPVVAVAGIARPDFFLANARAAGVEIAEVLTFPDHHGYDGADLWRIHRVADGRPVVTTAKDAVKLTPLADEADLWVLEQEVVPDAGLASFLRLLDERIQ